MRLALAIAADVCLRVCDGAIFLPWLKPSIILMLGFPPIRQESTAADERWCIRACAIVFSQDSKARSPPHGQSPVRGGPGPGATAIYQLAKGDGWLEHMWRVGPRWRGDSKLAGWWRYCWRWFHFSVDGD